MSIKEKLTKIQYHVTQQCGTEPPFSGEYNDEKSATLISSNQIINLIQGQAGQVSLIVSLKTMLI